jgi:uncharacterized protein (TIGR02246 family)
MPSDAKDADDPNAAQAIALTALDRWARAFAERRPDTMAQQYSERALFYGSQPQLFSGRDGVRNYFTTLRPRSSNSVRFENVNAVMLADGVVQLAALAQFTVESRPPVAMRLTQTLVLEDGHWLVAQHHASPQPVVSPP